MLNSGLLVVRPSPKTFAQILSALDDPIRVSSYTFPDQELLSDVFRGRWMPLPYVYNALMPMRWEGVHAEIWRDAEVRVVHYIHAAKPWHRVGWCVEGEDRGAGELDVLERWWWEANERRKVREREIGVFDKY